MSESIASKRVIAVDFDDVLMNFSLGFMTFHNLRYGTTLTYNQLINYDQWELVYGSDKETMTTRAKEFYLSDDHATTSPIEGALEAISRLADKYVLEIVTSRPETVRQVTLEWLDKHFPTLFKNFHFTNIYAGEGLSKPKSKSEVCREIGALALIDDALRHAEDVAASGIPVLLPDRPWNRGETPKGVYRVHNWNEAADWLIAHL